MKRRLSLVLLMFSLSLLIAGFSPWSLTTLGVKARSHSAALVERLNLWHSAAAAPAPVAPAMFATITVNSTADGTLAALNGNGTCDLREAIEAANTNAAVGECPAGM